MHFTEKHRKCVLFLFCFIGITNVVYLVTIYGSIGNQTAKPNRESAKEVVIARETFLVDKLTVKSATDTRTTRPPVGVNATSQSYYPTTTPPTEIGSTASASDDVRVSCDNDTFAIGLIASLPSNFGLRRAIRQTWAQLVINGTRKIKFVFVTGRALSEEAGANEELDREVKLYGDVVRGPFLYIHQVYTTQPLLFGLKWARRHCKSHRFIYVGLDYNVVNSKTLLERLDFCEKHGLANSRSWVGKVLKEHPHEATASPDESNATSGRHPYCADEHGYVIGSSAGQDVITGTADPSATPKAEELLRVVAHQRNWTFIIDDSYSDVSFTLHPCIFRSYVTMKGPRSRGGLLDVWDRYTEGLRDCIDPDLDLVLPPDVDNTAYLQTVLAYTFQDYRICFNSRGRHEDVFIVALVDTCPEDEQVREAIRQTWCKKRLVHGKVVRCVFPIGIPSNLSAELNNQLRQEFVKYGDIIQGNFLDTYKNLTLKIILGLKWINENCRHAKYVYKGDADMFVNMNNIVSHLAFLNSRKEGVSKFYLGSVQYNSVRFSPSNPNHQYYERYQVPDTMYYGYYYPPYCSGGSYIMSADVVPLLWEETMATAIINIEDAFVGILAKKVGVSPTDHSGFKNLGGKTDVCSLRSSETMTIHGVGKTARELYAIWDAYTDYNIDCTSSNFIYNATSATEIP